MLQTQWLAWSLCPDSHGDVLHATLHPMWTGLQVMQWKSCATSSRTMRCATNVHRLNRALRNKLIGNARPIKSNNRISKFSALWRSVEPTAPKVVSDDDVCDCVKDKLNVLCVCGACLMTVDLFALWSVLRLKLRLDVGCSPNRRVLSSKAHTHRQRHRQITTQPPRQGEIQFLRMSTLLCHTVTQVAALLLKNLMWAQKNLLLW